MSRSFPKSKRKYDIYLAVNGEVEIGRVLFSAGKRIAIRQKYTRQEWDRERGVDEGWLSKGTIGDASEVTERHITADPDPDPELEYFYGADYV